MTCPSLFADSTHRMSFHTENQPGVHDRPDAATRGFVFNHTMMRVKDP